MLGLTVDRKMMLERLATGSCRGIRCIRDYGRDQIDDCPATKWHSHLPCNREGNKEKAIIELEKLKAEEKADE